MKFEPKVHHHLSIRHLLRHPQAALFAGMGLGKTASTLTAFATLQALGEVRAMLVVAPLRVACLTWPNEIEKWDHTTHFRWANLRTKDGQQALKNGSADIYLTNYEQLQKMGTTMLPSKAFDLVCFDELTAAKNHNSKRINAVRKKLPARRWGLTGTPTPNSPMELFGQIRLLDGGKRLGPAFTMFRDTYFNQMDYMGYTWEPKPGAEQRIYERIADITLSLPQEEYSGIPAPITHDIEIPLPAEAREQYEELESKLVLLLKDETEVVAQSAGVLVNKLLQVTGGAVYREDKTVAVIHDAKLRAAVKFCRAQVDDNEWPTIVVTHYKHEQERLLKALPDARRFDDREGFLARWNAGKIPLLVVDPRTLSHGLNMQQGGHHILWYSVNHSREQYDQLIGRLARPGQKNQVHVTRLLCPGTIDDAVVETLRQRESGQRGLMTTLRNFQRLLS